MPPTYYNFPTPGLKIYSSYATFASSSEHVLPQACEHNLLHHRNPLEQSTYENIRPQATESLQFARL